MIQPGKLENRAAGGLTPRQAEAVRLADEYQAVAKEPPSFGWLARRLNVSRTSAFHLIQRARATRVVGDPAR